MKKNYSYLGWAALLLACVLAGCRTPVREIEENTKRVVSEQPVMTP